MKEGDLILVSAEATGLGKPMEAVIDKIETFMEQTLVTVTYTQPDALSGFGVYTPTVLSYRNSWIVPLF